MITDDMVDAIKVKFLKPIFEDDFPEKGMTAWLTDVEWDNHHECYKLYFDFSEFEDINEKYFKAEYFVNSNTRQLAEETGRSMFTAKESGYYTPKYSVCFSTRSDVRSSSDFAQDIKEYLKEVE